MNQSTSGLMAIVIFALLLFFFLSALTAAPTISSLTNNSAAGNTAVNSSGVGTPFVLPAGTGLATTPVTSGQGNNSSLVPVANATAATAGTLYTVQSGEWLQLIARRYSTTIDAILAENPQITDPSTLVPGQEIRLPVGSSAAQ